MKKLGTTIFVLLVMLLLVTPTQKSVHEENENGRALSEDAFSQHIQSSISDTGNDRNGTMFMSRTITGLNTSILNTYANPDAHNGSIDISQYHTSGWTMYNVTINTINLTASFEKEVVGITHGTDSFMIYKNPSPSFKVDALTQGFYNEPYNGSLVNYSIRYRADKLDEPQYYGYAYTEIRTNYDGGTTNITSPVNLTKTTPYIWLTVDTPNTNLTQNTTYWAMIDGTNLVEYATDDYPTIRWSSEDSDGGDYGTKLHIAGTGWNEQTSYEALMNYTYIPWNISRYYPLDYQPEEVSLRANGTQLTGDSWTWTNTENISNLNFDSNQSIQLNYNLTMWYKRDVSANSSWYISGSGMDVKWNSTTNLAYPDFDGLVDRYLNASKPTDWIPNALYNESSQTNHDNFTAYSEVVTCANMTNGTWTLTLTAPNYIDTIDTFDSFDNSELQREASILVDMDINTSISDESGNPANTGSTNLTVIHEGGTTWVPSNESVSDGKTNYLWDINTETQDNGTYTLEVYWTNGTEAGYLTKEIVVFYPTSLEANRYSIDAYTESSFSIRVEFNDTYNDIGLNGSVAVVEYSFDGETNQTMTDQNNGTWTADVSTAGRSPGSHTVEVFGEGFAIENQSLTISVYLLHDTEPLTVEWSDGSSITYVEQATLVVNYSLYDGTPVVDAEVNVTIGTDIWDLTWSATDELYLLTFNGTDDPPGIDNHQLNISAWKSGYEAQINDTTTLTITEEPTSLEVSWSATNNITYVQTATLQVNYSMSNGTEIDGAILNVTIDSNTWNLTWNGELYTITFNGTDDPPGFGTHPLDIKAGRAGYEQQTNSAESLTITTESTTLEIFWSNGYNITYLETTRLSANYTMSNGSAVLGAEVNITAGGLEIPLTWNSSSSMYDVVLNGTDNPPDLGTHDATISAWKYGFDGKTNTDYNLSLREEPTLLQLEWYDTSTITYTQSTTLRANYTITNGSAIQNAWINVTIGSDTWNLTWNSTSGFYELIFNGTDEETGLGTSSLTVQASKPKYVSQSDAPSDLIINPEPTDIQVSWNPSNVTIDTTQFLNLSVKYTYGGLDVPDDATVNVTMESTTYDLLWNGSHWVTDIPGDDFPADVYDATISAWRYGYESKSNTTFGVNITLAPNAFQVFWNPTSQNISYIESISVNVTYNYNNTPIENATVCLILNDTLFCDIPFNESIQKYSATISAPEITLGTWNATIVANKTGYETKQDQSYLTVYEDTPSVLPSWTSNTTDYITPIDLYVEFYASNGTPITDGSVEITVDSETYLGQHVSQGNYSVTIGPKLVVENNTMTLYVNRYGYALQEIDLYLNVIEASTTLRVNDTGLEVYYDETVDVTIEYLMSNSSAISPANLTFLVNGEEHSASWTGTYWETTLNATLLEVGIHDCVVNVSAYGFVSKEETFQVQVSSIPTTIEIEGSTWLYVNDSIVLKVEYLDSRTSTRIEDPSPSVGWAGPYEIVENANLTYSLTVDSTGLHVDDYSLTITFSTQGYDSVLETPTIEVRPLPLSLIFDPDMEIYENETMRVSVRVNETYHAELIDFAQVNLTIAGTTYALDYDGTSESYRASIWLNSTISPADYTVALRGTATDCQVVEDEISLQVLAKAEYALTVELVSQTTVVTEGSALAIRAVLEDSNGGPLAGKTIVFYVRMIGTNGETVESTTAVTNDEGSANAGFDIPSEINALEVWGRYEGSESEWPTETESLSVEVRPAPSLLEVLISTVRTPQAQLVILVALVAIIGAIAYTKVIKPRREAGRKALQKQLEQFRELSTLQHFMAIYTEHGTCVIYFPFTEKHIEPDLISGFISAITSVYSEITGEGGVKGTLEEIHYHGLRLNSYSGRHIIGILILESEMSAILKRRLEFFVEMFESQYESDLEDWMGRVECFDPEWVLSNLLSTLDYYWLLPQKIADEKRIRKENKTILRFLQNNVDEKDEFCIDEILAPLAQELAETEAETLERLLTLQEEGAIEPISVQTLMTRRGLGLSGVEGQGMEPVPEEDIVESSQESEKPETETALPSEEAEEGPQEEVADTEKPTPTESIVIQEAEESEDTVETEKEEEPEDKTYAFLKEVERHLLEEKKRKEKEGSEDRQQE